MAEFVGTMNRLPGAMIDGSLVSVLGAQVPVRASVGRDAGDEVDVLVRPEGLAISQSPTGDGIVSSMTFRGSHTRLEVMLSTDLTVKVDTPSAEVGGVEVGSPVALSLTEKTVLVDRQRGPEESSQSEVQAGASAVAPPSSRFRRWGVPRR